MRANLAIKLNTNCCLSLAVSSTLQYLKLMAH